MTVPPFTERQVYERIYSSSQDSVFLLASDTHKILFANPRSVQDTGFETAELGELPFEELFLPEDREAIRTMLQSTLDWKKGTDPKRQLKRKSGKKIITELNTLSVEFEGRIAIYVSMRDITGRVKAEEKIIDYSKELERVNAELEERVRQRTGELAQTMEELQERKKGLDEVMNNIEQGIITVGPDLKLSGEYSHFSLAMFGKKQIAGLDLLDLFFPGQFREENATKAEQLKEWINFVFREPEHWEVGKGLGLKEFQYPKNGQNAYSQDDLLDFELVWKPIFIDGRIVKMMIVCNDVTERRHLRREIAKRAQQHEEELELFGSLLSLSIEAFDQFLKNFSEGISLSKKWIAENRSKGNSAELLQVKRLLHTLKGNARQMRLRFVEKEVHALEELIQDSAQNGDKILDALENLEDSHARIRSVCEKVAQKFTGRTEAPGESPEHSLVPIPLNKLELLFEKAFWGTGPYPALSIRRSLAWLIQIPIENLFRRLKELSDSLSKELYVPATLSMTGGELRVDPRLIEPLYEVFLHLIRNSLDHGREPSEERKKLGKSETLSITVEAFEIGVDRMRFVYQDDGAGVDPVKIRQTLVDRNLLTKNEANALEGEALLQWLFFPGFSTREEVTEISGRGVGMNVVKESIEKALKGKISIQSTSKKGVRVEFELPSEVIQISTLEVNAELNSESRLEWEHLLGSSLGAMKNPGKLPVLSDIEHLKVRTEFSGIEVGLGRVTPDQVPIEIFSDDRVKAGFRHFVDQRNKNSASFLRSTLTKLNDRKTPRFGLEAYLWPSARIKSFNLKEYSEKSGIIEKIEKDIEAQGLFSSYRRSVATMADEMMMNACFDAPRTPDGKPKYNHLQRSHPLVLEPHEAARVRFGSDPCFIGVSVEDPFGALDFGTLLMHLRRGYQKGDDQINLSQAGGAGLGLFMIFDHAHFLVVNRHKGKRTEFIALISQGRTTKEFKDSGRSLSFFEWD